MNDSDQRRVLVIDDELFVRDLLDDFFGKLGFDVVAVADGPAGINAFRKQDFHIILVDLKMPGMGGTETLRELRAIRASVPIIIMTGYPTIDSSIEALRLGAYDYIIKPFKLQELRELVERAIKEQELHTEIDTLRGRIAGIEQELRDYRAANTKRGESPSAGEDAWRDSPADSEKTGSGKTRGRY